MREGIIRTDRCRVTSSTSRAYLFAVLLEQTQLQTLLELGLRHAPLVQQVLARLMQAVHVVLHFGRHQLQIFVTVDVRARQRTLALVATATDLLQNRLTLTFSRLDADLDNVLAQERVVVEHASRVVCGVGDDGCVELSLKLGQTRHVFATVARKLLDLLQHNIKQSIGRKYHKHRPFNHSINVTGATEFLHLLNGKRLGVFQQD